MIPSLGEFPGGKGPRSNDVRRSARGGDEKFVQPFAQTFRRSAFHPLRDDTAVLRPALRRGTHRERVHQRLGMRRNTLDTAERRGVINAPAAVPPGRVKAAHPFTDAASAVLTLRQGDGSPSGRRRFTGSVYDSPGSRREVALRGFENTASWYCQSGSSLPLRRS